MQCYVEGGIMSVKDIIATIPKEAPQQKEEFDLQKILQNVPEEGYDCKGFSYRKIPIGNHAKNYTGQKIEKLLVLFRVETNKKLKQPRPYWLCLCECNNLTIVLSTALNQHSIKGCGLCFQQWSFEDLTGTRQGHLYVKSKNFEYAKEKNDGYAYWNCICDCGRECIRNTHNLKLNGENTCCGICYKEKNITGQKYHSLIAEYSLHKNKETNKEHSILWHCKCDCGNYIDVLLSDLTSGRVKTCGHCEKRISIGEKNIREVLDKNNIKYIFDQQYFKDLIFENNQRGRYDFILLDKENKPYRLIEFDGEQHYGIRISKIFDTNYERILEHEIIKDEYAKKHNLPLVRIPYWERENITLEMLMSDKYLVT